LDANTKRGQTRIDAPRRTAAAWRHAAGRRRARLTQPAAARGGHHRGHHHATRNAKFITGIVNQPGYTVLVVGYDGKVAASKSRRFRIAAPEAKVTLQLLNPHGLYAGPVVLAGSGARVITGLKAPAALGAISVLPARGYGKLARPLARRYLDASRWADAKAGVPIGNGLNLGLVASSGRRGGGGPGQDQAHVGIPNEFDVAVPGTHILKSLAPAAAAHGARAASALARAAQGGAPLPPNQPPPNQPPGPPPAGPGGPPPSGPPAGPSSTSPWMSQMFLAMNETINDDAAGTSVAEIDATLQTKLNLKLLNVPASASLAELNCNGLTFCSGGGTGQAVLEGLPQNGPNEGTVHSPQRRSTALTASASSSDRRRPRTCSAKTRTGRTSSA
jgi:hypothetical protein